MLVITDLLKRPFDEGAKNTAFNIIKILSRYEEHKILSINGEIGIGIPVQMFNINKSFLNISFLAKLRALTQKSILYVPESSATLFSLIRAKLLHLFSGNSICILALQPRKYNVWGAIIAKVFAPRVLITPSKSYANYLQGLGLNNVVIPLGVDDVKFNEYSKDTRIDVRRKFDIEIDKMVLLHVGHIRESRNLGWLLEVKRKHQDIEIIIVGSTYNKSDQKLYSELEASGIRVFNQYIENMADLYNLADYYVFPVIDDQGAIATPLSVLEAMSCNIPILTTKFGSLVDMFQSDKYFHFIDKSSDILEIIKTDKYKSEYCNNRGKAEKYTWNCISDRVQLIMKGLE